MRATIDAAGRTVIPKLLRDEMGLVPSEVELVRDGAAARIEPVPGEGFEQSHGGGSVYVASVGQAAARSGLPWCRVTTVLPTSTDASGASSSCFAEVP